MSELRDFPQSMIDKAAKVLYNSARMNGFDWWGQASDDDRRLERIRASAILAAALDGCEVREEHGFDVEGGVKLWYGPGEYSALRSARYRRLVITTRAVPTETPEGDPQDGS